MPNLGEMPLNINKDMIVVEIFIVLVIGFL